ncbi:MAG: PKD domain-containing protein [bacterium]|nr:PKD domain-containing protein [bacterium]
MLRGFTITNGSATSGGGIYCGSSSPTLFNCFIISNSANNGNGGGIYCYSSSPTITNCTISGNLAKCYGGGISCDGASSPTVVNSILWGDSPLGIYLYGTSSINITYSNIQGSWAGKGNINADPQFVGGGDYHLLQTSPCIDNGSNTAPAIPPTDKDGNPRIVNGIVDMGAYEYQGPFVPAANFSGTPTSGTKPLLVQFTDLSTGSITSWSWQFGDGGTSTQASPAHTYTTTGTFTVSLEVTSPYGSDTATKTDYIVVASAITSITHNAAKTLGSGDVLTVTMQGVAGGKATFTVSDLATTTMTEVSAGTYKGTYTVKQGDNVANAIVTGYLLIETEAYSLPATSTITIDTTAPAFTVMVSPDPADIGTLTIIVTPDELLKATPTLTIKDSNQATITATLVSFLQGTYTYQTTIASSNADGTATISVRGTDSAGNIGTASKTFQISIPRILTPNTGIEQMATVTTILQPFVVKMTDNLNRPIQGHTIKWTIISLPASATLSATLTTTNADGLASTTLTLGTKTGNYIVTAEGLLKATFTATGTPDVLDDIKILPDIPVPVDQDILFTATGYDRYRNEISGLNYTWEENGNIGTLTPSPTGTSATLHTAPEYCLGTITVATLTVTRSAAVEIVYGELSSVTIDPATVTVEMQGTMAFTAQSLNQNGFPIKGATYTWTLTSTGMGTLNPTTGQNSSLYRY